MCLTAVTMLAPACQRPTVLEELDRARNVASDLRVQLNKGDDASNQAVMADTDEASVGFAKEAQAAARAVESDMAAMGPLLKSLGFPKELQAYEEFKTHWSKYQAVNKDIVALAVENTNLKAQRLSFGPARKTADSFRDAVTTSAASAAGKDRCSADELAEKAILAVREIQVLQAPHIAEVEDAAMTRIEQEMAVLDTRARDALKALTELAGPSAHAPLDKALASLDDFKELSRQIVSLSRRNTNVRSLELSLREKPPLMAACDNRLQTLQSALANEGWKATR